MPRTAEDDARLAERLMTGEAWDDYCDRLKAVGRGMLGADFPSSPRERAEGFRHLVRVAVMGLQWAVEFNARAFPIFYRQADDINKWGGPNVDNLYLRARIDGASTYKLTANLATVHDAIISIQNGDMHEGNTGVSGDLDRAALDVEADGSVEVTLSPEPAPQGARNWIQLPADADHVCIRQFFYDWDAETPAQFHIVKLGNEGAPPRPLTPARMGSYLDQAANWVETSIPYWNTSMAKGKARRQPLLRAVTSNGRIAIIYSREDITSGLVGYNFYGIRGYSPDSAVNLMINLVSNAARSSAETRRSAASTQPAPEPQ